MIRRGKAAGKRVTEWWQVTLKDLKGFLATLSTSPGIALRQTV